MVQFIRGLQQPQGRLSEQLGQSIAQGIGKNLPQPEMLVQRKMLSEAFDQAKKAAASPDASPLDLAFSFLQATAGIPGAERYVGQVLPLVLQQARGQAAAGGTPPIPGQTPPLPQGQQQPQMGQMGRQMPTQQMQGSPQVQQVSPLQQAEPQANLSKIQEQFNLPQPDIDNSNLISPALEPTELGMGPLPNTYSAAAIEEVRKQQQLAGLPEAPAAQAMEEYNNRARKEIQDYVGAAENQARIAELRRQGQERFGEYLEGAIGSSDPVDLAIANTIANQPQFRNMSNDRLRADAVAQQYRKVDKLRTDMKVSTNRPSPYLPWSWNKYEQNFKNLQAPIKKMIDMGLRDQARLDLTKNGWTRTEVEQLTNPLGKEKLSEIEKLPSFPEMGFGRQTVPELVTGKRPAPFKKDEEQSRIANESWDKYLQKAIRPGKVNPKQRDVVQPGTSLTLLRNEYMKKGGNWLDFSNKITEWQQDGKIELDDYQMAELPMIRERPVESLELEEFLFGTKSL